MAPAKLSDPQWDPIFAFVKQQRGIYTGAERRGRRFVEAVLWMLRRGAQWRLLPGSEGKWNSVYKRFIGWGHKGIWEAMPRAFADDPDLESLLLDSPVVRAHAGAAGAVKNRRGLTAMKR